MRRPRDSQRSRLYAAEQQLPEFRRNDFDDHEALRAWINKVATSAKVRRRWAAGPVNFELRRGGGATAIRNFRLIRWGRTAPKSKLIALHELAHLLGPANARHGVAFAATYLELVKLFLGPEPAKRLRASFVAHRVRHRVVRRRELSVEQRAALAERLRDYHLCKKE